MNEGESAGGGHQGSNPAPPAVPDRISSTTTTTATTPNNVVPTTTTTTSPFRSSKLAAANKSIASTEATTAGVANTSLIQPVATATSPVPRSFQQAFAQHQLQKQETAAATATAANTTFPSTAIASSPTSTSTVANQSKSLMPQTPTHYQQPQVATATTTTDLTAASSVQTASTISSTTVQQATFPGTGGSSPDSNPPLIKRKKLEDTLSTTTTSIGNNTNSGILLATSLSGGGSGGNNSIVGSLLPTTLSSTSNPTATSAVANITNNTSLAQDIQGLKKHILEQKYSRLRRLKEKHSENVAELFYLQTGGNMMDYPTWRKKAPTPQFITFSNAYRLDQLVNDERTTAAATTSTSSANVAAGVASSGTQQQQQTPVADNIATIIGVTAGSHTNVLTQQANTQSHQTSLIASSSSPASLVSNQGRLPSSTTISSSTCTIHAAASSLSTSSASSSSAAANTQSSLLPTTATDASGNPLPPQGAEIKIPAVGATPVAVSTKLPAAVQQLTQQGHIPGRPLGGRHGMVFGQIPAPPAVGNSTVPLVPGGTPLIPCSTAQGTTALRRNGNGVGSSSNTPPPLYSPTPSGVLIPAGSASAATAAASANSTASTPNSNQEFSFKAKQEVDVMRRIMELQREGLWTEKRLPKQLEPARPKAHWDYLLEEMVWLAADFAQERKWKKAAAKKCAKMVQKYFQDKANAAQKAEKAQEAHLRRVAAFIAKEVKMFWGNVEKLVEYKHHTKMEEKRKKALDQHLSFIVDQTEKFSQQLAEGMNKTLKDASANPSMNSSRISSPKRDATDDEFRPDSASEDDEETIAKAEEEEKADVDAEVAALAKESQMDLDDFLKDLPKGYLENRDKIVLEVDTTTATTSSSTSKGNKKKTNQNDSDDGEFEANESSEDDENTISKQEEQEMDVDHQKELNELEADNDLTVEELMAKYKSGKIDESSSTKSKSKGNTSKMNVDSEEMDDEAISRAMRDSDDDSTDEEETSEEEDDDEDEEDESEDENEADETEENEQDAGLKSLLEDSTNTNSKDDMIKDAAALAESLQPKGNTLSSTNVVTPVPFLLKHTLREYQHIGLDWLVTMNERKLNGILADEMGLGKTIQTIALLAHLACVRGNWGPHLIVVPSSVMLNWEMEFKKWCPGFKILTYYGSQKERKLKRVGWTKPNAFHVCITSYKLVVQDQQSFRRKKWKYLILDEAQNIKNFKSQRWQLLLNFSTERRLLLTGTPLQNDLMELWSLMHFLMPYVFSSHREFKEWFSNPMTGMIEGNMEYNETLIQRLHKVIRPFLLRRLKKEVEKQMPKKYEHVVMCRLSNRQRYLYEDFMSRSKTRETLQTGNLLSVINILMQLRKVCNHPNMFEVRPTISPFQMEGISYETSRLICDLMDYDPSTQIDLHSLNLLLVDLEVTLTAYVSHKSRLLAAPRKLIEEIDSIPDPPPRCPTGKYKFHIRVRDLKVQQNINTHIKQTVRVGASPAMRQEGNKFVPVCPTGATTSGVGGEAANSRINKRINNVINPIGSPKLGPITPACITRSKDGSPGMESPVGPTPAKQMRLQDPLSLDGMENTKVEKASDDKALVKALAQKMKTTSNICSDSTVKTESNDRTDGDDNSSETDPIYNMSEILQQRKEQRLARLKLMANVNKKRTEATPIYGADCRESIEHCLEGSRLLQYSTWQTRGYTNCITAMDRRNDNWTLNKILKSYEKRCGDLKNIFQNYVIYVPSACAPRIRFYVNNLTSTRLSREHFVENAIQKEMSPKLTMLHPIISSMTTQFPDPRLIQYDCGKLQTLDRLLKQLKSEHHRVLIFTQMTKMLDVLEAFLNHHGHIYLRLDGATKVEQRQLLMERFNSDKRIFCFILSTRSGGVGINLTGADTVIFYDSDWNPTMDAQAQDRCHRIGQTRDVHIYRLVSEKTIEVNILKKANQKRMLSDMAIEGGNFTTSFFKSSTIKDLFNIDTQPQAQTEMQAITSSHTDNYDKPTTSSSTTSSSASSAVAETTELDLEKQSLKAFESALAAAEDEQDVQATKTAKAEAAADLAEFDENIPLEEIAATADANVELSKADLEMQNLVKQLSPIERYAMRFVEETGAAWTAEQLRAAEEELEAQKREWEANRLAALQKEEELLKQEAEADEMLTYARKDATNQVNRQKTNHKSNISRNRSAATSAAVAANKRRRLQQQQRNRKVAAAAVTTTSTAATKSPNERRLSRRQQQLNTRKKLRTFPGADKKRQQQRRRQQQQQRRTTNRNSRGSFREDTPNEEEGDSSDVDDDNGNVSESVEREKVEGSENDENSMDDNVEDNKNKRENEDSTEEATQSEEDIDESLGESRQLSRSRLRSLRGSSSGSFNKKSPKTARAAAARRKCVQQSLNTNTTNRKITRTSMAAAAAGKRSQQRTKKSTNKAPNRSRNRTAGQEASTTNVRTGVKNQKLLSFARKRMKQKRQEMARTKSQAQLKRKSSLSPAKIAMAPAAKRRATKAARVDRENQRVLRHSPRKAAQQTEENDENDDDINDRAEDNNNSENEDEDEHNDESADEQQTAEDEEDMQDDDDDEDNNEEDEKVTVVKKIVRSRPIPLRSRGGKTMKPQEDDSEDEGGTNKDDNDEEEHTTPNDEDDDKSSYATAGENIEEDNDQQNVDVNQGDVGNSSSMDTWNVHNQMQDTTTNSTYYNVSDESESEDNESLGTSLNSTLKKTPLSSTRSQIVASRSSLAGTSGGGEGASSDMAGYSTPQRSENHTPRTRSRGSVKINLWNLDDSPVLHLPGHSRDPAARHNKSLHTGDDEKVSEQNDKTTTPHKTLTPHRRSSIIKRPLNALRTATETPTKSGTSITTLHRWLLKTPRYVGTATTQDNTAQANGPEKSGANESL